MTIRSIKNGSITSLAAGNTSVAVPTSPTIGTATADGATGGRVSVAFTPATFGATATSFTVTSSPESLTGTGASSPINVDNLTAGTSYTFTVTATNANGTSTASAASNSTSPISVYNLSQTFNTSGTYTVPSGKTEMTVYLLGGGANGSAGRGEFSNGGFGGGGGGSGGGLAIISDYSVSSGQAYTVTVGAAAGASSIKLSGGNNMAQANGGSGVTAGGVTNGNVTATARTGGVGNNTQADNIGAVGASSNTAGGIFNTNVTGLTNIQAGGGAGTGGSGVAFGTGLAGGNGSAAGGGNGGQGAGAPNNNAVAGNAGTQPGAGGGGGGGGGKNSSQESRFSGAAGGAGAAGRVLVFIK